MGILRVAVAGVLTMILSLGSLPATAATAVPPLGGAVVRAFDPPAQPWLSGHRGVDLLGSIGTPVVAALAGRVTFAGELAGRGVVVVTHGGLRTTYLPLRAGVRVGQQVATGEVIGELTAGHSCPGGTCLHWGLRRDEAYLDPLQLLGEAPLRLLPSGAESQVESILAHRETALASGAKLPGLLARPVTAAVGSGFGMRLHPIFKQWRLHNGVDLGAACGTLIRAAAAGRVTRRSYDSASGHRLEIDHGVVGGHRLRTGYLHATGYTAGVGDRVTRGQVIGRVGSTGWSTGCHLHFITWLDDAYSDPERFW